MDYHRARTLERCDLSGRHIVSDVWRDLSDLSKQESIIITHCAVPSIMSHYDSYALMRIYTTLSYFIKSVHCNVSYTWAYLQYAAKGQFSAQ